MSSASSRQLFEQALTLLVRQHGGAPEASAEAARALDAWSSQAPEHAQARRAAEAAWQSTEAGALRDSISLPDPIHRTRRRVISSLGIGVLAILGAQFSWRHLAGTDYARSFDTRLGELATHALPDGSRLDLAPRTHARVQLNDERRRVVLDRGTIRFAVARDPARPFIVISPWGEVRVLGTVFSVSTSERRMTVAVASGRVSLRSEMPAAGPGLELTRGQQARLDAKGWHRGTISPDDVGAWQRGWLVFNDTSLPDAVARWNDYLPIPIRLDDDAKLNALRLTGSFPLDNPTAFLDSLPDILPVRVARDAGQPPRILPRR